MSRREPSAGVAVLGPSANVFRVALIGSPVGHSLSPRLHEAAYAALGLHWRYGAIEVPEGAAAAAIRAAQAAGYVGLSVTTPLKFEAALAGAPSAEVGAIGAANTVVFSADGATLHNTDGEGLLDDARTAFGFDAQGSTCAVIGAGATGRAIVHALGAHGAREIVVVNRSEDRARSAARLAPFVGRVGRASDLTGLDLVVFAARPASPDSGGDLADFASSVAGAIAPCQRVIDVNYVPARTTFLEACRERGATARGGLGMLVYQAARQVALFTGKTPPIEKMWQAVRPGPATEVSSA